MRMSGAVMKKAKGGVARGEGTDDEESGTLRMEKMPSGAQQYVRGSTRPKKYGTLEKQIRTQIDKMIPGSDDFFEQHKKANKLIEAAGDNNAAYTKEVDDRIMKRKKAKEGKIMKKATGGMAMEKGYAKGGMPMVMKDGKKVPSFAADGKGKMAMGGMATKNKDAAMKHGGMAHGKKAKKGRGMAIMIAIGKPKGRGKS